MAKVHTVFTQVEVQKKSKEVRVRKYKNKHVLKLERAESTDICAKISEVLFAVYDHTQQRTD